LLPRSASGSSQGFFGRIIFGGQATSAAESGHMLGILKSGALLILLHHCSGISLAICVYLRWWLGSVVVSESDS